MIQPVPPGPILELYLTQVAFIIQTDVDDFQRSFEAVCLNANFPAMTGRELATPNPVISWLPAVIQPADPLFVAGEVLLLPPLNLFPDPDHFFLVCFGVPPFLWAPYPRHASIVDGEGGVGLVHAWSVLAAVPLCAGTKLVRHEHLTGLAIIKVPDAPRGGTRRVIHAREPVEAICRCLLGPCRLS